MKIRKAKKSDADQILKIFYEVIAPGDTYVFTPDISKEEAQDYWMNDKIHCYVVEENDTILGCYVIRNNRPGLGSHVANASFIVSQTARGKGVGKLIGNDALKEAKNLGYQAMQFNFVVSTNEIAVKLWQSLGFKIIGTSPKTFNHKTLGLVDTYIMHRFL